MNIDLTHPEILTIEQLQKFVGSNITNDGDESIQLFYKYIAPLPQRKFRENRLGTILTKSQREFQEQNQLISSDFDHTEKTCKSKSKSPIDGLNAHLQGNKHESDRGIYTITMQKSGNKNTAPIKLKRPSTTPITNNDHEANKRIKLDDTNI